MAPDQKQPEPILASWKISEVLQRHPQLLDTLIGLSPAFGKLHSPLLRKVQARLVTVAQAAGIAGIDPAALTRRLNQAAGITPPEDAAPSVATNGQPAAPPAWVDSVPVAEALDVRPLMSRGEEPFKAIMGAARGVPVGAVLRLTVGFEPLPLYDALAKYGFAHHATRDGDTWRVDFLREREAGGAGVRVPGSTRVDWDAPATAEVTIDVSELVPPEPMVRILQTLETLPDGARLLVHHVRRPMHLYDRLEEMGYAHETRELAPGRVEVLIRMRAAAS